MTRRKVKGEIERPRSLDFQAVGRVIAKVAKEDPSLGEEFEMPQSQDLEAWERVRIARLDLANSISWAYHYQDMYADFSSDSRARQQYENLAKMTRLVRTLCSLMDDPKLPLRDSLAGYFPALDEDGFHIADLSQTMFGLERLQQACMQEREHLKSLGLHEKALLSVLPNDGSLPTPGSAFISHLGKVFEQTFGKPPSFSFTAEREPSGPFLAFVEAVTTEMGAPLRGDAVRKAWERAQSRTEAAKNLTSVL